MLGRKERDQLELFMTGSLRQLVPDDHILARVDRVLDLDWLREEVSDLYCADNGRPGIDPEVAVRLMLAGFLLGMVHHRRLMREAQVNVAIRWFIGYGLHETLPDHSSLTRIRQRWGAERFRRISQRTVHACITAKIAGRDRSYRRFTDPRGRQLGQLGGSACRDGGRDQRRRDRSAPRQAADRQVQESVRNRPDATMATNARNRRLEPAYKQHTAVDDQCGVIVDVEVATGEQNEGMAVEERLNAIAETTGSAIATGTMDAGYAYAKVFRALEDRGIEAIVPAKAEPRPGKVIPTRRFKFDALHNLARCPRGKILAAERQAGKRAHSNTSRHAARIVAHVRCGNAALVRRATPASSCSTSIILHC